MTTPVQPDQPITVTLQAQQWNVVLAALGEMPAKHSMTVIQAVMSQCQAASENVATLPKPNGADDHVSH